MSPSAVQGLPPARRRVAREHVGFHEVRGFHRVSLRLFSPFSTDYGGNDGSSADYTTGVNRSLSKQVLAQLVLLRSDETFTFEVRLLPKDFDEKVAKLNFPALGSELNVPDLFKGGDYRY